MVINFMEVAELAGAILALKHTNLLLHKGLAMGLHLMQLQRVNGLKPLATYPHGLVDAVATQAIITHVGSTILIIFLFQGLLVRNGGCVSVYFGLYKLKLVGAGVAL